MSTEKKMTMSELHECFTKGLAPGERILDVRDEDEYAEGHIPGSRNIPHDRVDQHAAELAKHTRIFIHCGGGGRAGKAFSALEQAGLKNLVHIHESGMRHWLAAGWVIEK